MMKTDQITQHDYRGLEEIHAKMGSKYLLPDLTSPLFIIREACRDEDGKLMGGVAVKAIGEAFLFVDPDLTTRKRVEMIRHVSRRAITQARDLHLEDVSAWIPPNVEPQFAHMLIQMGWIRSPWPCWSRCL